MPVGQTRFVSIEMVEGGLAPIIQEHFPDLHHQYLDGERGRGRMLAALAEPAQTFGGKFLHRTTIDKAAALWRTVTLGHPFLDGNKRKGLACCHIFLSLNGYILAATQQEVVEMAVAIAENRAGMNVPGIARWLRRNALGAEQLRMIAETAGQPGTLPEAQRLLDEMDEETAQ